MASNISGEYLATCACQLICPCSIDGKPTGPKNTCTGSTVFHIAKGDIDGVPVSGVNVAMLFHLPSNFTAGNVSLGLIIDQSANDEQAKAVEQFFSGQIGGPFAEFVPLIGKFLGAERAKVTFTGTKKSASATVGKSSVSYEAVLGPDGNPAEVRNAPMAFRTEGYRIGPGKGHFEGLGLSYDSVYGEGADFEYTA